MRSWSNRSHSRWPSSHSRLRCSRSCAGGPRRIDPTDEALERLQTLVAEETASAAEELKSRLARMRADALSSLIEEERELADERRREFADRERAAGVELAEALSVAARRVDERLRAWGDDLDRAQQSLETDLRKLEQRQKQLIADAEARIEAEASELVTTSTSSGRLWSACARSSSALPRRPSPRLSRSSRSTPPSDRA